VKQQSELRRHNRDCVSVSTEHTYLVM
jgi:hypothetical protein